MKLEGAIKERHAVWGDLEPGRLRPFANVR
jgi:hypothetical protein